MSKGNLAEKKTFGRSRNFNRSQAGFTLIELLVVTVLIGALAVIASTTFASILRSQNKTAIINEVRQNGNLVIDRFERDVRQAKLVTLVNSTSVQLTFTDGSVVTWDCTPPEFRRGGVSVINADPDTGVKVDSCNFTVSTKTVGKPQIVRLEFTLSQRNTISRAEFQASSNFEVTVGTRAY